VGLCGPCDAVVMLEQRDSFLEGVGRQSPRSLLPTNRRLELPRGLVELKGNGASSTQGVMSGAR